MDKRIEPQWQVSGLVEAPVEKVWNAFLEESNLLKTVQNAPEQNLIVTDHPYEGRTEIDMRKHTIMRQGHWWYRGMQSVEAHPRGSLIRYEVSNIAPGIGWWAAQMVQSPQHAQKMASLMESLLHTLGERLNCRTILSNR